MAIPTVPDRWCGNFGHGQRKRIHCCVSPLRDITRANPLQDWTSSALPQRSRCEPKPRPQKVRTTGRRDYCGCGQRGEHIVGMRDQVSECPYSRDIEAQAALRSSSRQTTAKDCSCEEGRAEYHAAVLELFDDVNTFLNLPDPQRAVHNINRRDCPDMNKQTEDNCKK